MGPPLGHVRDPEKQRRFVEAELSALLQAAGGTLPVIKKNEKGVYVMVEAGTEPAHPGPPPAAIPATPPAAPPKTSPPTPPATSVPRKAKTPPAKAAVGPQPPL